MFRMWALVRARQDGAGMMWVYAVDNKEDIPKLFAMKRELEAQHPSIGYSVHEMVQTGIVQLDVVTYHTK